MIEDDDVYAWGGWHVGRIEDGELTARDGRHIGRFKGKDVFDKQGRYLGELREHRLIAKTAKIGTAKALPFRPLMRVVPLGLRLMNDTARDLPDGYEDFPSLDTIP